MRWKPLQSFSIDVIGVISVILAGAVLFSSCAGQTSSETDLISADGQIADSIATTTERRESSDDSASPDGSMESTAPIITDADGNIVETSVSEASTTETTETTVSLRWITAPPETTTALKMENHEDKTFSEWSKQQDAVRIEFAKKWYTQACETYAAFMGSTFTTLDTNIIEYSQEGMPLFLVATEPYANDFERIYQDHWYSIFSKQYDAFYRFVLSHYQKLEDEKVYALPQNLGKNDAYVETQFLDAGTITESEVKFQIRRCYSNAEGTIDDVFSLVYEGDGNWKVGQFKMPY